MLVRLFTLNLGAYLLFTLFCLPSVHAQGLITRQITHNTKSNQFPAINAKGDIVWQGIEENNKKLQIFFYNSRTGDIIQISDSNENNTAPQINSNDQIVWQEGEGRSSEIFFYDGKQRKQLTQNFIIDRDPQINNEGKAVWEEKEPHDWEIMLYDGNTIANISDNFYDDHNPRINNKGVVVWQGMLGSRDDKIYLYDPNSKTITKYGKTYYYSRNPFINDNGRVAWESERRIGEEDLKYDLTTSAPNLSVIKTNIYRYWEIFFYDGKESIRLTYNKLKDRRPKINIQGDITWEGLNRDNWEIFLWNQNNGYKGKTDTGDLEIFYDEETLPPYLEIKNVSSKPFDDINPVINDQGWIARQGFDGNDWEIFLYDSIKTAQLTDNDYDDTYPQVNDKGEIAWQGFDGRDWQIFLAALNEISDL